MLCVFVFCFDLVDFSVFVFVMLVVFWLQKWGKIWMVVVFVYYQLWQDGMLVGGIMYIFIDNGYQYCFSFIWCEGVLELLYSLIICVGLQQCLVGVVVWIWIVFVLMCVWVWLCYDNFNGLINIGVIVVVKQFEVQCVGQLVQCVMLVMLYSVGVQEFIVVEFDFFRG